MQPKAKKWTTTTLPRSDSIVSGGELSQAAVSANSGVGNSGARAGPVATWLKSNGSPRSWDQVLSWSGSRLATICFCRAAWSLLRSACSSCGERFLPASRRACDFGVEVGGDFRQLALLGVGEFERSGDVGAREMIVALGLQDEALQAEALRLGEQFGNFAAEFGERGLHGRVGAGGSDVADRQQQEIVFAEHSVERGALVGSEGEGAAGGIIAAGAGT